VASEGTLGRGSVGRLRSVSRTSAGEDTDDAGALAHDGQVTLVPFLGGHAEHVGELSTSRRSSMPAPNSGITQSEKALSPVSGSSQVRSRR